MSNDRSAATDAIEAADWNEWYADPVRWPPSRHVFLADAAMRLGRLLCEPWYDEYFVAAGRTSAPLPRPHLFQELPSWSPYRDGSGIETVEPDLVTGSSRPADWTADEEIALVEADIHNNIRHAARLAIRAVARGLAVLAAGGKIDTVARPLDGSDQQRIDPRDWDILDPIDRIATCRIVPGDRTMPGDAGTHLIFVDENQLEKRLRAYARENQIALNDGGVTVRDSGILGAPKPDPEGVLVEMCETAMRAYLAEDKDADATRQALKEQIRKRTGRKFSTAVFERARSNLLTDFKGLAKPGRRQGPQGPRDPRVPRPTVQKPRHDGDIPE